MGIKLKAIIKTAAVASAAYLAMGDAIYGVILNKKFTQGKNVRREVTQELHDYYGSPESQVDSDSWFVAVNPDDTVVVNSYGKEMHSHIFMHKEYTDKWAIVVHGYTSCPRAQADQAFHFYKQGYNVLMPYMISFGLDQSNYCSMGYHDKIYVKEWAEYIASLDNNAKIVVLGVSMGSATTMMLTGEDDLVPNIKCAIADCGYTSAWDVFKNEMNVTYHLPAFPFLYAANTVSKLRGNFDFKKCSPLKAVAHSKTPTLFIHGEKDAFVPYSMLDKVYDACTAEKQKLSVPDAMHAESHEVHPEIYYPAVFEFVEKYFNI
ncbi:MAG: alpha/beta hydrolase [Clostridia bacterium]|nr:alpha/beta hydrolase [Clostridia bacterium]